MEFEDKTNDSPYPYTGFTIDHSFLFDGVDEYFIATPSTILANTMGGTNCKYTFYATFNQTSASGFKTLLEGHNNSFRIYLNNGRLSLITNNNAKALTTLVGLAPGVWHNIAISVDLEDTSNCKITLDGVDAALHINNLTSSTATATTLHIGRRSNNSNYFNGNIVQMGVVNKVTTLLEDQAIHNNGFPLDIAAYYGSDCVFNFNPDNSGDTAQFSVVDSVNSITATSVNMEGADKSNITPYPYTGFTINKSFLFDGVDEYFTIPNLELKNAIFSGSNEFTFSIMVKMDSFSGTQYIFDEGSNKFRLYASGSSLVFTLGNTGGLIVSSALTLNEWSFITVAIDLNNFSNSKMYLNGIDSSATNTISGALPSFNNDWGIGRRSSNNTSFFNGNTNQVSIINKVLTSGEVLEYYNNGLPLNPQDKFGSDCKWFFNPDNSGDTAQFSVVDSVNSITATSVNMENTDKTNITPYVNKTLAEIISDYGFLHAWSPENITEAGTTTTLNDYLGVHDLSNPTAAAQPTLTASNSDFGGKPSLDFSGSGNYLTKTVTEFRPSDTTGSFVFVLRDRGPSTGNPTLPIAVSDSSSVFKYIANSMYNKKSSIYVRGAGVYNVVTGSEDVFKATYVASNSAGGTNFVIHTNGNLNTNTVVAGSDTSAWLDSFTADNITIGASIRSSGVVNGSKIDLAFVGYLPYTDSETTIDLHIALQNYYNV